jgi:ribosome-associated translation inhibitor RaiA
MKLPLEIVFREMLPLPSLEPEIRRRAAKLEQFSGELMSCRVVVEAGANRRHQGHEYRVTIDVRVPDEQVAVSQHHRGDDAQIALRAAFDAMDRRLDERSRQRRDGPRHGAKPTDLR